MVRVDSRLRRGLLVAAVLLMVATGLRSTRIVAAWSGDADARRVAVDALGGGLRFEPDGAGGFEVRALRGGLPTTLASGTSFEHAGTSFTLERSEPSLAEILRRDWSVFAPVDRCGFRRIDAGSDPLGRTDGVRDRVVVPGEGGLFHLAPGRTDRDCFRFDDRSGVLVAERPLTVAVGAKSRELDVGDTMEVARGFSVQADGVALRWSWEVVTRTVPVVLDGEVVGYRAAPGVDLVVTTITDAGGAPRLVVRREGEVVDRVSLSDRRPAVLFGRDDRVGPLGGGVLPGRAADEELEDAFAQGLAEGWIRPGPARTEVDFPEEGPSRRTARSIVGLLDVWDRARAPVALRIEGGRPAAGTAEDGFGRVPLRWNPALAAWVPSHLPKADGDVVFRVPVVPGEEEVTVEAAFPIRVGEVILPTVPGRWARHTVPVDGSVLELRLDARPLPKSRPGRLAVALAGGPDGTRLDPEGTRRGRRAFAGWTRSDAGPAAKVAWESLSGDRWTAEVDAPPPTRRARSGFLRVALIARSPGWAALDLTLPGRPREAWWNDEPFDFSALPSLPEGGNGRVSLPLRRGDNTLAVRWDELPTAPPREAGGVRFAVDEAGRILGLAERVADRRARPAVLHPLPEVDVVTQSSLLVESGVPGLSAGATWRVDRDVRVLVPEETTVLGSIYGALEHDDGLRWRNGPDLAMGLVRRVESDPDGPPSAGFRVAAAAMQALPDAGDAIVGPLFRLTRRAVSSSVVEGDVVVLGSERLEFDVDGEDVWTPGAGIDIRLRRVSGRLQVASNVQGTLWTRAGARKPIGDAWSPWPTGGRAAWRLPEGTLRLLHRTTPGPPQASTEAPVLQAAAESSLRRVVGDRGLEDGDSLALRAAVLAMNARTGDILACAHLDRPSADPRTRTEDPCVVDVGLHPGSTFKVAVATAALGSSDPVVGAMVNGELPEGLVAGGPRATLRGARLPRLPMRSDSGPGRRLSSRLKNHRAESMPPNANLEDAMRSSLNTWFGYAGLLMHAPLREGWGTAAVADPDRRADAWPVESVARAAGFGKRIDLGDGTIGTGGAFPAAAAEGDALLAARSIGQGDVTATPLGVATLLAPAVAQGWAPVPRRSKNRPIEKHRMIDAAGSARLRDSLHAVVAEGTAARAFSDHPRLDLVLGKTGSSQRIDADGVPRTDGWFVGAVLPPEEVEGDPVVIVAVVPGGGLGGRLAAEVVDSFSRDVLRGYSDAAEGPGS